jgi:hypothetical protein
MGDSNSVYSDGEMSESVDWIKLEKMGFDETVPGRKAERYSSLQTFSGVSLGIISNIITKMRNYSPSRILHLANGAIYIALKEQCQHVKGFAVFSGNVKTSFIVFISGGERCSKVLYEVKNKNSQGR